MSYPGHIWNQLKNLSAQDLADALEKDGWIHDEKCGAVQVYRHSDGRRVTIHFHSGKTYGPKLLKELLKRINWSLADMQRLKLISK